MTKNSGNILVAWLAGLLAISLAISGYLFWQNTQLSQSAVENILQIPTPIASDDIKNWKTYTNEKYGFEFKYPENLIVTENGDGATLKTEDQILHPGGDNTFGFSVIPESTSEKIIADSFKMAVAGSPMVQRNRIINGYSFTEVNYADALAERHFFVINNNRNVITLNLPDQILGTFRFLDNEDASRLNFVCPENGWLNCMPVLSAEGQKRCRNVQWFKDNCPNFQGVAI